LVLSVIRIVVIAVVYCSGFMVDEQYGVAVVAVPDALNRITPVASEQNARCPVVPTVTGVAVAT
jgi:hypothetical protein